MSILDRTGGHAKPVEEMARAIYEVRNGAGCTPWRSYPYKPPYRADAVAALTRLRELGYINDIGLEAIKAEERK